MQMNWTGNVEENFRIWFKKFELYLVALEKTLKPNNVKCSLYLHIAREKEIEVYNALTFMKQMKVNIILWSTNLKNLLRAKKT